MARPSAACAGRTSRRTGRTAGASSTGRVRVGPLWVGPPWETPPADAIAVVIDPGRAFGTGAHATTRLCLELLRELAAREPARRRLRLRRARDRGGEARLRAGRRASTSTRRRVEATPRERGRERRRRSRCRRSTRATGCLPEADVAVANIALDAVERSAARLQARLSSPRATSPPSADARRLPDPSSGASATAGRPTCASGRVESRADGDVLRPLSGLQGLAHRRAGGPRALLADGHEEARRRADVAVVNTCCVTHEAVRKSRQAAARAARTHARVYVTGCAANLAADAFAGCPANVVVVARRARRRRRSSPATSARSAACRPTRGSTACARS